MGAGSDGVAGGVADPVRASPPPSSKTTLPGVSREGMTISTSAKGGGSLSKIIGKATTVTKAKATAPIRRRRALRFSASAASIMTTAHRYFLFAY